MSDVFEASLLTDIVNVTVEYLGELFEGRTVLTRPLRPADPGGSLAVFPVTWVPVADSLEIAGIVQGEPILQRYDMRLQNMAKAGNEEDGRRQINQDAKFLRAILYRDQELAVRLRAVAETLFNVQEHVKRFSPRTQRFVTSEIRGTFVYLATTEWWIETESV